MPIWSAEIKELERLNASLVGQVHLLEKEMGLLLKTEDENVAMLYSRRCLEVIVTDLCETELKRPRKTEPLKGIIDKLNKEEKVPSYIITSMHGLNSLSTYGAHPKDFDPDQVKPALSNLAIIMKWYLAQKGIEIHTKPFSTEEEAITGGRKQTTETTKLEKSVAVLPFINDSPDQENTYFINGVMEEILNNLQKIKALRVISRTSAEKYRDQKKSVSEIAEELGVNYIVEGSGQKYGNVLRLRAQLIMAEHESHLWGESFQQKITDAEDIFNIQIKIAESIANELKTVISPEEKRVIEKVPTKDLGAYEEFLKGRFYLYKFTTNDFEIAIKYFESAIAKDPQYAPAYSGIAFSWLALVQMGFKSPEEAGPVIQENLMKALEIDSENAEVQYTLAGISTWALWDWRGGEEAFKKTLSINPNHSEAHAYYSHFLLIMGRPQEEVIKEIETALKLDPLNPLILSLCAVSYLILKKLGESIKLFNDALEMDPDYNFALSNIGEAFYLSGRVEEALEKYKAYFSVMKLFDVVEATERGIKEGGNEKVFVYIAEALERQYKASYWVPAEIAWRFVQAGDKNKALDWLEVGYEKRDQNMPYLCWPIFDPLRGEPRFQEIVRKMNLPYQ